MNRLTTSSEIEFVIKKKTKKTKQKTSQQIEVQDLMASQGNSNKHIRKNLIPILFKIFQKFEEDETLPN